jgi:hypothetical protein
LWVDSIANSEELSTSGRLAQWIAHRTCTQWPQLATRRVAFWGSVL